MRLLIKLTMLLYLADYKMSIANDNLFPHLPAGTYQIIFKGILQCNPEPNKIHLNFYLNKKSSNSTEIKGNITSFYPLDDLLYLDVNMAVKDTIGGWKDNAFLYKSPNACKSLKHFLGSAWIPIMTGFGMINAKCPIPTGIFVSSGIDLQTIMLSSNFPKTFFYGTYKFRLGFSKSNEMYGCIIFVVDLIRPWEKV